MDTQVFYVNKNICWEQIFENFHYTCSMKRNRFLKLLSVTPFIMSTKPLSYLGKVVDNLDNTERMPVLFLGHGSPMNAIEENQFVKGFRKIAEEIPQPNAILCISAHWLTRGTYVTAMDMPRTIHDFGGFPQALYEEQYPAKGSPKLAEEIKNMITSTEVGMDQEWGLDHGAWTVLKHMYPDADIPVLELSIDYGKPLKYHFELAKELNGLRDKGVLIVGSGNLIHNLRMVDFRRINDVGYGYDWAIEANEVFHNIIAEKDYNSLLDYSKLGRGVQLAIPTPDHYIPMIYALALDDSKKENKLFNDELLAGSLSMTSIFIH